LIKRLTCFRIQGFGVAANKRSLPDVGRTVLVGCCWKDSDSGSYRKSSTNPTKFELFDSGAQQFEARSKLGRVPLRSNYPSLFVPCRYRVFPLGSQIFTCRRLVQIAKRQGVSDYARRGMFRNVVEDLEFTFVLLPSVLVEVSYIVVDP
jgi:hypothetical protein